MNKEVTRKHMFSFGIGDIYGGGAFFIIGSLFLVFLTDVAGLRGSVAGVIILLGKVWDAVTDPTMGYISDHTKSKYGRRRLYFIIGIVPIFLSFSLLWVSFSSVEVIKFTYYLFVYLLFNTVFTMVMVPYNSLPAEMTSDYEKRSKMIGVRMLFSQLGMLFGAVFAKTIVNQFQSESTGYLVMGLVFGLIYALPWYFVYKGTFEREDVVLDDKIPFKNAFSTLIKEFMSTFENKSLKIHVTMYLCAFVAMDIFNALFIYYLRDYLHMESSYQLLLGVVVITQIFTLILVVTECKRSGNAKTYRRHMAIWGLGFVIFSFVTKDTQMSIMLLTSMVVGMGLSGAVMVPYNMLAFVTDADEIMTTKRREGTYSGMMTFVRKIAQAIALFLVGVGIEAVGYQSSTLSQKVIQSTETITGIRLMFIVAPALLLIIGFIVSYQFKISPKNHQLLIDDIDRLKAGGSKDDVDQNTKEVIESITGQNYDDLWKKTKR